MASGHSTPEDVQGGVSPEAARVIAEEAFVFGLPLVYIQVQIDSGSNVPRPQGPRAPVNQFAHFRQLPDAADQIGRGPQRRHPLLARQSGSVAGTAGAVGARDGRPLLADAADRRLERRAARTRGTDHRWQGWRLRPGRAGLDRASSRQGCASCACPRPWGSSVAAPPSPGRPTTRRCTRCRTATGWCRWTRGAATGRRRPRCRSSRAWMPRPRCPARCWP